MTFVSASRFRIAALAALVMACQHDTAGPSDIPDDATPLGGALASIEQESTTSDGLTTFVVRVRAHDMTLSAYQGTVHFSPGTLELVSKQTPASDDGAAFLINATSFAEGRINFAAFTPETFDANGNGAEAFRFTVRAPDPSALTQLASVLDVVGTDKGAALRRSSLSRLILPRPSITCNVDPGVWGDANGDHAVNVADAQQISRYTAGLSVANVEVLSDRGDVNADGNVDIIDAQQIARFSVGLSTVERVNGAIPIVAASVVVPGAAAPVLTGSTTQLSAFVLDGHNADIGGCVSVTWSSSDNTRATVDANGTVTALTPGVVVITATAAGQSGFATLAVAPGGNRAVIRSAR